MQWSLPRRFRRGRDSLEGRRSSAAGLIRGSGPAGDPGRSGSIFVVAGLCTRLEAQLQPAPEPKTDLKLNAYAGEMFWLNRKTFSGS
jgi:hypothetical protein